MASTLTLPILVDGRVTGSINLYAASTNAFTGQHEAIAEIFSVWAPGAVANADLAFSTHRTAEQAPRLLFEEMRVQVDPGQARQQLHDAALRAGVDETALAEAIIEQATQDVPGDHAG